MTLEEYTRNISNLAEKTSQKVVESVIVPAANELLATVKNRIIRSGLNSNEQKIGDYSTKEAYFTREQFDRRSSFRPKGKSSTGNFKNGNVRKSMYLQQGYKELRNIQGKPTDNIKANYTGSTMASYQQDTTDTGVVQGMVNQESSKVRRGLEKQKGQDIYKPSPKEIEAYKKNVFEELEKLNIQIITGVSN